MSAPRHEDQHELMVEAFAALTHHHLWAPDGHLPDLVERLTEAGFAGLQHSGGQWSFAMAGICGNHHSPRQRTARRGHANRRKAQPMEMPFPCNLIVGAAVLAVAVKGFAWLLTRPGRDDDSDRCDQ